jgi:hypothetical protein
LRWLLAVIPLAVGGFLGYDASYQSSVGGFGGGMGAAFLAYAIGGLVLVAGLVGIGNLLRRGGRGRVASRYAFAVAGLLAGGSAGGAAAVPLLDLGYHNPDDAPRPPDTAVQVTLDLTGVDWSATSGGGGRCEFEANGSVWTVASEEVGLLRGMPLSLAIGLLGDPQPGDQVDLNLNIHIASPSQGATLPLAALLAATSGRSIGWAGLVTIDEIADGGRRGRLTFSDLPNEGTKDPEWPAKLSGELSWECR